METFLVGGAVRDSLLNREVKDRDFVVTGATEQEMLDAGFTRVGADFPVFLHPETKDEHALARRERKTGSGHKGFEVEFDPTVTLGEDLGRRDLTINAIAQNMVTGEMIDPFNGVLDIANKVFSPVNPETFVEDPVRALRVIRFMARFGPDWSMSSTMEDTLVELMDSGEFKHLVKERVLLEMTKALAEPHWWLFFSAKAHGRTVFNEVMCQMLDCAVSSRVGMMDEDKLARTDPTHEAFTRACDSVTSFKWILETLNASNDMMNRWKANSVFKRLNPPREFPFAEFEKMAEEAHLFNNQHPVLKILMEGSNRNEFFDCLMEAREVAMKFKFNDVRLDDDEPRMVTAERLNDLRVSVLMRETERRFNIRLTMAINETERRFFNK